MASAPPGTPSAPAAAAPAPPPGPPAPALDIPDLEGRTASLDQYRGRPLVINFWASWCEPCQREMPSLVRLNETLAPGGLSIVAVSIDTNRSAVDAFLNRRPLPMRVLLDPRHAAADRFGVGLIPASFVVDSEGRVLERLDGEADWMRPDMVEMLRGLLAGPAPPAAAADRGAT